MATGERAGSGWWVRWIGQFEKRLPAMRHRPESVNSRLVAAVGDLPAKENPPVGAGEFSRTVPPSRIREHPVTADTFWTCPNALAGVGWVVGLFVLELAAQFQQRSIFLPEPAVSSVTEAHRARPFVQCRSRSIGSLIDTAKGTDSPST